VTSPATIARPLRAPGRTRVRWPLVAAGCVLLAALSLLVARQTTYDPSAWLLWGREIVHGDLSTTGGPSWKPLPVVVTAPAALLGDLAQQQIWLVVARAATLVAVVLAYRLAWRLGGTAAGVIAAGSLLLVSGFVSRDFRGNSEGLLAALGLGAVEAHLAGRRRVAFGLLVAAALVRPELVLLAGPYAMWLVVTARRGRPRRLTLAAAVGAGALVVASWAVPERIGSGDWLRAASRALDPIAGLPVTASRPFIATFTHAAPVLPWPVYAAGAALVVLAIRDLRRDREPSPVLGLAGLATALMVVVALMSEVGFTGSTRYLTIPIALTCVLGGVGCARLAAMARSRLAPRTALAAIALGAIVAAPFVAGAVLRTRDEIRSALRQSALYEALPEAVARAGGRAAVLRCGAVTSGAYDTPALARELHVHQTRVGLSPQLPGTIFDRRGSALTTDRRFAVVTADDHWVVRSSCRSG
jgi:hypothetical protein